MVPADLRRRVARAYPSRTTPKMDVPAGAEIRYSIVGTWTTGTVWSPAPGPRQVWVRRDGVGVWDVVDTKRLVWVRSVL